MDYFAAIRAFLQVAELGSFSKAAQHMGVKTSTISRHISALEDDLAIALFNRSTRGIRLTEGGHRFHDQAVKVMGTLDEARAMTSLLNESPQGKLRIALPRSYGKQYIMPHIPAFLEQFPYIDLDIVFNDRPINLIDAELDLAIRIGTLENSRLIARKLAPHRRILCASTSFMEQHDSPQTPSDAMALPSIRLGGMDEEHWWMCHSQDNQRIPLHLSGRVRVSDEEAAFQLVMAGAGIALLPEWQVKHQIQSGALVQLLPEWQAKEGDDDSASKESGIWCVYTHKKTVSSKVRTFIDYFVQALES